MHQMGSASSKGKRGATVGFVVEAEAIFYFSWVSNALLFSPVNWNLPWVFLRALSPT